MQNKANLLDSQMNVSPVLTKDYENDNAFRPYENKAKLKNAKMNLNLYITKDYEKKP